MESLTPNLYIGKGNFEFESHLLIRKAYQSLLVEHTCALHQQLRSCFLGIFKLAKVIKDPKLKLILVPGLVECSFVPKSFIKKLITTAY